jgi:hypothetical protein
VLCCSDSFKNVAVASRRLVGGGGLCAENFRGNRGSAGERRAVAPWVAPQGGLRTKASGHGRRRAAQAPGVASRCMPEAHPSQTVGAGSSGGTEARCAGLKVALGWGASMQGRPVLESEKGGGGAAAPGRGRPSGWRAGGSAEARPGGLRARIAGKHRAQCAAAKKLRKIKDAGNQTL